MNDDDDTGPLPAEFVMFADVDLYDHDAVEARRVELIEWATAVAAREMADDA